MTNLPHTGRTIHVRRAFPVLAAMLLLVPLPSPPAHRTSPQRSWKPRSASAAYGGKQRHHCRDGVLPQPPGEGRQDDAGHGHCCHVLSSIAGDYAVLLLRKRMPDGELRSYEHPVRIRTGAFPSGAATLMLTLTWPSCPGASG